MISDVSPTQHPPPSLFRYQRFTEWLRCIVIDSELYFPVMRELNDPCEFCYHIDVTWNDEVARRQIQRLRSTQYPTTAVENANPRMDFKDIKAQMDAMPIQELLKVLKRGCLAQTVHERQEMVSAQLRIDAQTIGICCFADSGTSGYMSHNYADHHTGVCLEFSTDQRPFSSAKSVVYQHEPPTVRLISDDPLGMELARMFVKSPEWQQEREWRIVNHRINDGSTMKFSPRSLVSISLGPDFSPSNLPVFIAWVNERRALGHEMPKLYRLQRRQDSYQLERQSLDLQAWSGVAE